MKPLLLIGAIPVLIIILVLTAGNSGTAPPGQGDGGAPSSKPEPGNSAAAASEDPRSLWVYGEDVDSLTDAKSVKACLPSDNALQFDFPYEGGSTGTLCFFKRKGSMLVNLFVDKGQFLCDYEGCTVAVRVNDGPVQRFGAGEASSGRSDVLVLHGGDHLLHIITGADRVRIAASFYQYGQQTFEFSPAGFDAKQFSITR